MIVCLILVLIFGIGATFAADVNQTDDVQTMNDDASVSARDIEAVSVSNNHEKIANGNNEFLKIDNNDSSEQNSLLESTSNDKLSSNEIHTFTELADEISKGGKITLKYKYYQSDSTTKTIISIPSNTIIDGNNAIINGTQLDSTTVNRIIQLPVGSYTNITLKNINFISGQGIEFRNVTNLNIENCNFTDTTYWCILLYGVSKSKVTNVHCKNIEYGFYTNQQSSTLKSHDIIFNKCYITNTIDYGFQLYNSYLITFQNCEFKNVDSTLRGRNGGSRIEGSSTNVTIIGCNFIDGLTAVSGGALNYGSGSQYCLIKDCLFKNNIAGAKGGACNGGAIEFYARLSTIDNCTFINNKLNTATKATNDGIGGAIVLYNGANNITIKNSRFINNTASEYGGAIGSQAANCKDTTIFNCNFTGNSAPCGGAIYYRSTGTIMNDCTFNDNVATGATRDWYTYPSAGGAVYADAQDSHVDNCKFENNTAADGSNFYATAGNSIEITNCGFDLFYVSDTGTGDGLRSGAPTSFINAVQSIEDGGKIYLIGTFTQLYNQRVEKPVNLEGYNNEAIVNLNGLNARALTIIASDVSVKGITFKNSKITDDGGAIYWSGANGKVDSCTFDNNTATNGGAIYWAGVNGTVLSSTFTKNTATANGGAIYWAGDNGAIDDSTFSNNNAVYGSAVFLKDGVSTFELKESTFTSNAASNAGTVAAEQLTTFSLGGNTFTGNTATTAGTNEYYFYEHTPIISSSLVYVSPSGSATSNGLTESTPTTLDHAIDSVIEQGGEIVLLSGNYNFACTLNNMNLTFVGRTGALITGSRTSRVFTITGSSNIIFDGLTFKNLTFGTTSLDSVISVSSSNLTIKNSEFNTVSGSNLASVVLYDASSTGNITGTTFTGNTATNIVDIKGNVDITGSTFTNNKATTSSVNYASASKGTISGTTFSTNSGTTRNLYVGNANIGVTGNTFDTTASLNSMSNVIYPANAVLSGTFNTGTNYAFTGVSAKNGNTVVASGSVSSSGAFSATWTKPLPGTYTITLTNTDGKGNIFNYATTPSVSVPVKLSTVYIAPSASGAKTGVDASNPTTWDNIAGIVTDDANVKFIAGTYYLNGKTIDKSWKLSSNSGTVIIDAQNNNRIFTITGNNVAITGITFKNGKVSNNQGSAISWSGNGGSISNSVFNDNTGVPISSTNDLTITNTQMKNQVSLTINNINWGSTETIKATFSHSAPGTLTLKLNNIVNGTLSKSNKEFTKSIAFTNTQTQNVGSYVVSLTKINMF